MGRCQKGDAADTPQKVSGDGVRMTLAIGSAHQLFDDKSAQAVSDKHQVACSKPFFGKQEGENVVPSIFEAHRPAAPTRS